MNRKLHKVIEFSTLLLLVVSSTLFSQTEAAYEDGDGDKKFKLFDKERLTVNHSLSFGMSSSSYTNGLMSQSLYATMLKYQFSKPVTVKLNFGLPIHNTYDTQTSLNSDNIKSADYFRNIPFNASITWQPTERLMMHISVMRDPTSGPSMFQENHYRRSVFDNDFMRTEPATRSSSSDSTNGEEKKKKE